MEFLEQRLRLELQEPAGKSQARLRDGVGRLPINLPLCPSSGLCLCSPIHPVLWHQPLFQQAHQEGDVSPSCPLQP